MKQRFIFTMVFLFAATSAFGQDKQPEMMRGANLAEPSLPIATIVVGANEIIGSLAEPGWPVIVSAAMFSDAETPLSVPANLKIKMTNENDIDVPLVFEPVARPAGSDAAALFWIAAESATQGLAQGRYHVTVEPIEGFRIESGDLIVVETDPERSGSLGLLHIQRSLLLGQDDEALAQAEGLTASDAQNAAAWIAKGDILMGKDLPDEALEAYDKALEIEEATDSEPLFIQERRRAAFFRSLEKRGVITNDENTQQ